MARRLAEAEQRLEHVELHLAPVLAARQQRLLVVGLELVVAAPLAAVQLHQ